MKDNKSNELEFSTSEILRNMCHNIYNNYTTYELNIVNKNYLSIRNTIFNIMQKITMKFGFKSQTFFLSAYYLDLVFIKKKKININIYKLGLACLCLSAKFCENDPIVPQLPYFVKIYNNITGYKNFISMSELMYAEVVVCKILKYKLNYFTSYDFISFFFCNGILKLEQIKEIEKEINTNNKKKSFDNKEFELDKFFIKNILGKIYRIARNYLDEVIKIDKICLKYNPIYIAIYLVEKSMTEFLGNEYKISNSNLPQEELANNVKNFCDRNKMYYKEIMNEFYKIHFENNEQYLQLIIDDEINNIFKKEKKNKIKEKDENVNNRNQLFNSTMTSRFYKKLKLSLNDENQKDNEIEINLNKAKKNINKQKKKEIENENINTNINLEAEDDLNSNLNINELSKEMNYKYSHISNIKHIPKISMDKINSFNKTEGKKTLILNTEKSSSMKYIKSKDENNLRKTYMPKSNTNAFKISSSFKTLENNGNKLYSKKLLGVNNRNIAKSINQAFKASTLTNFYPSKIKNITKTESNNSSNNAENSKKLNIKEKPRVMNTATTKKYKKIIHTKNELSSKILRSKKIFKEKFDNKTFSVTKENIYPPNNNKINVNKIKNPEMQNLNINKELRTKKISYKFSKDNLSINNSSKDINKTIGKHYISENNDKCIILRNDSDKIGINDDTVKCKKKSYSKIHSDFIQSKNNKKNEIKKIIFTNKPNNHSIKEGYSFKTLNNINNGSSSTKQYKTINKDKETSTSDSSAQTTFSSFYNIIKRTKNLFNKDKNTTNKTKKIENSNLPNKEDENKNFYKSQQNFYKKEKIRNDENSNNDKKEKVGNTIIINNNININIGDKKDIKIPEINVNNTILTSDKKSINIGNKFNTQKLQQDTHENNLENNSTTKKTITFKNIFQKFNFNKKVNNKFKK